MWAKRPHPVNFYTKGDKELNDIISEIKEILRESQHALLHCAKSIAKEKLNDYKKYHPMEFEQALTLYNQETQETVQLDNSGDCYLNKPQSSQMADGNVSYALNANGENNVQYPQQEQLPYAGYLQYLQQEQLPYAGYLQYPQQEQLPYAGYLQYPQQEQLPYAGYLQYVQIDPVMTMPNQMGYYQGNPFDSNIGTPVWQPFTAIADIVPSSVENKQQKDNTQSYTVYYDDPYNVETLKCEISQKMFSELKSKELLVKSKEGNLIVTDKADLKNRYKDQFKHQKIADFVVSEVKKDNKGYMVSFTYKTGNVSPPKSKTVFISIKDAASGNICKRLREEGIPCEQNISNILFSIFENKAVKIETPDKAGLDILGDRYFMTTQETLAENSFPPVTEKSFDMNRASDETPMHTIEHFCRCIRSFSDMRYIFTLILIRMMAIMTNVFANNGIRFRRLISTEINCYIPVSYTHLRAHETPEHLVCRLLLEKKKR